MYPWPAWLRRKAEFVTFVLPVLCFVAVLLSACPDAQAALLSPSIGTQSATGITTNAATLNAIVNPNGAPTAAYFQYGLTTGYGTSSPTQALSAGGLNFDGVSQYASQTLTGLNQGNSAHTIEVWLNPTLLPLGREWVVLLSTLTPGAHHWLLLTNGSTQIGSLNGNQIKPTLSPGVWTHVAASFDGTTLSVYTNGVLAGATNASFNLSGGALTLAQSYSGESYYGGGMDDLRVWNTARSATQIQSNYNATLTGNEPGLLAWLRMNEGAGATLADASGHGNNVTNNTGVWSYGAPQFTGLTQSVTGLSAGATYHYRTVASNVAGITLGGDQSFVTLAAAPTVTTQPATNIHMTGATLNGMINPNGTATTWYFQYGLTTNYGSFTTTNSLAATNVALPVSTAVAGLSSEALYHYRLVGSNNFGNVLGGDLTFTTLGTVVISTNDGGPGSLRQVLTDAPNGSTITFSVTGTIMLTNGLPLLNKSVVINGAGATNLTISGSNLFRPFLVNAPGKQVVITGLTIADGRAKGGKGGNGAGGGGGFGGGLLVTAGDVTLSNVVMINNSAVGGDGAANPISPCGGGGGGIVGSGGNADTTTYNYASAGGGGGLTSAGQDGTFSKSGAGGGPVGGSGTFAQRTSGGSGDSILGGGGGGGGKAQNFGGTGGNGGLGGGGGGGGDNTISFPAYSGSGGPGGFGGGGGAGGSSASTGLYDGVDGNAFGSRGGDGGFGGGGGGSGNTHPQTFRAGNGSGGYGGGRGGLGVTYLSGGPSSGGGGGGGGGGAGMGGAIFMGGVATNASLTLIDVVVGTGSVAGGNGGGGDGIAAGAGSGGAGIGNTIFLYRGTNTFTVSNGTNTISGEIVDWTGAPGSIQKNGTGTLVLGNGNNNYHGSTVINAGTLRVNGNISASSNTFVLNQTTLAGTGTVGLVTLSSGGTLVADTGTFTTGNNVWNGAGNLNWQIYDATGTAGSGYGKIQVNGTLDLSGAAGFNINLSSLSGNAPAVSGNANNFTNTGQYAWTLVETTGGIIGFNAANFVINTAAINGTGGFSNPLGGRAFTLSVLGNRLMLSFVTQVPEIAIEQPTNTPIADGGTQDFGAWNIGADNSLTFTVRNTGNASVSLSGLPLVVSGANASDFTVTTQPPAMVGGVSLLNAGFESPVYGSGGWSYGPGGSDWTFGSKAGIARNGSPWFVTDAPEGSQAAFIQLNSADAFVSRTVHFPAAGNYVIRFSLIRRGGGAPANDIDARMDGVTLGSVSNTSQPDDTWRTFSVSYDCAVAGDHTLAFVGTRGGADNASALDNVQIEGTATFQVTFAPMAAGPRTATLSIPNNDSDENPYDLTLTGTGLVGAEIAVFTGANTNVANSRIDNVGTNVFATTTFGNNSPEQIFTIKNAGLPNLTGLGVTVVGANPGDFILQPSGPTTLSPNAATTFSVTFAPTTYGVRSAVISIASNDGDENPFEINVAGRAVTPAEIAIEQPLGTAITNGASKDFGTVNVGTNTTLAFALRNTGGNDLVLSGAPQVVIIGANAADFTVTLQPGSLVSAAPSGLTNMDFETPVLSAGGFTYAPGGAEWTFGSSAGMARNGSPWFVNATPQGSQAAFIQRNSNGDAAATISRTINFSGTGPFLIRFSLVRRGSGFSGTDVAVRMDGTTLDTILNSSQPGDTWRTFSVPYICTNAGNHTLSFVGTRAGGDYASAIDNVQIDAGAIFQLTFTPSAEGVRTASLSITNSDSDENPYVIALTGIGGGPEITIEQPSGTGLADGGSKDFGSVNVDTNKTLTFVLRNTGTADLLLTGTPKATVSGPHASDFVVTTQPVSPVLGNGDPFSITNAGFETPAQSAGGFVYNPGGSGWTFGSTAGLGRNGSPWFVNAAPEGLQAAFIQCTVAGGGAGATLSRSIQFPMAGSYVLRFSAVRRGSSYGGTDIAVSMDGITLGTVLNSSQPDDTWRAFTLPYVCTNAGNHTLSFAGTRTGGDYASAIDNVQFVGATTFQVRFTPTASGLRTASLSIASNDGDENPYDIALTGTGFNPLAVQIDVGNITAIGGSFRFGFSNGNNATFTVLASTNLSLPIASWDVLGVATNVGGGNYQFTDPGVTNAALRFYQLRSP